MKIAFICGTAQPGMDGVGDYTRVLAGELVRMGHVVTVFALRDKYVDRKTEEIQFSNDTSVKTIRFSLKEERSLFDRLRNEITSFNPDVISLQFVPYSFNKYGIPLGLPGRLVRLGGSWRWHVMIHEPYIVEKKRTARGAVIQMLQKLTIKRLNLLRPVAIHTSIDYYRDLIKRIGIDAAILGLFGNINVYNRDHDLDFSSTTKGIYFGAVPPSSQWILFADKLHDVTFSLTEKLTLFFCGRGGGGKDGFVQFLKDRTSGKIDIIDKGEQNESDLSRLFQEADFGISRVPTRLIGKSGAAIAMLEHGLPLWVPLVELDRQEYQFDFRPELCFSNLTHLIESTVKRGVMIRLPEVAKQFLRDINSSN